MTSKLHFRLMPQPVAAATAESWPPIKSSPVWIADAQRPFAVPVETPGRELADSDAGCAASYVFFCGQCENCRRGRFALCTDRGWDIGPTITG